MSNKILLAFNYGFEIGSAALNLPNLLYKVKVMTSQKWKVVDSCTDLDVC